MTSSAAERQADPRYAEAGTLFDAQLARAPWWGRLDPRALGCIRAAVQDLAAEAGPHPGTALEQAVARYVKMNEFGQGLLGQCRAIARIAARARQAAAGD